MPTGQTSRSSTILGLMVVAAIVWIIFEALRTKPPRLEELVGQMQATQASLEQASRQEWAVLRAVLESGESPEPLPYAILGDGIAGAAAAVNIKSRVAVFGTTSFWASLHGVAEVWQTGGSLSPYFKNAGLIAPEDFDTKAGSERFLWLAVENSRLEALGRPGIRYLHSPCKSRLEVQGMAAAGATHWRILHCENGHQDVAGPLLVATGVNEARTILSPRALSDAATRRELVREGRLISGDDYLAQSSPSMVSTLVVLGAGGNAADVARHALSEDGASLVVIKGPVSPIESNPAHELLKKKHGENICRDFGNISEVKFSGVVVEINGLTTLDCITLDGDKKKGLHPDLLVESLGRELGKLPAVLRPVAAAHAVESVTAVRHPGSGALLAVRVQFKDVTHPVYLLGGVADLADSHFAVSADLAEYKAAREELRKEISKAGKAENPLPGFAAAAFMGSEFARKCFKSAGSPPAAVFDEAGCVAP